MKTNLISAFHYIIFFQAMLLLTPPGRISIYDKSNECDYNTEKTINTTVARENTVELLNSELLFKY